MNSLIVALATSAVGIALATSAGYAMSRWGFPGRDAGMRIFLITQMFPGVVMAIPLYILLDELGMLDSLMGLSVVYATTAIPFCTWNMKGYFDTIPVELEEAARMDGADRWTTFWHIVLRWPSSAGCDRLVLLYDRLERVHPRRHLHER